MHIFTKHFILSITTMLFVFSGQTLKAQACATPTAQPSSIILTPTTTSVSGSFTAASGADSYLIVRSTSNTLSASPVNTTTYSAGNSLGGGTVVAYQSSTSFSDNSTFTPSTIYYYFVFAANSVTCTGGPLYLSSSPLIGSTTIPNGSATFTSSGTWTCPTGVSAVGVACRGGGGGGGAGGNSFKKGGGGGGGGAYTYNASVAVSAGTTYNITVGSGGAGGASNADGAPGIASSFNVTTVVANGGNGGESNGSGASGGTGGTGGTYNGGNGDNGSTTTSGGGGGGAGSAANGGNASGTTGGIGGTTGGGAGGNGTNVGTTAGGSGAIYGAGGGGGTGTSSGGSGASGNVVITCPCGTFTPTFTSSATANTCVGYAVTYTTQSGQTNYAWTVSGTENTDYSIVSGGISASNHTVTLIWLTTGSKTVSVNYTSVTCAGASAASSNTTVATSPADPTFTASPPASLDIDDSATYTTQASMYNYTWTVPGTANVDYTITSGGIGTTNNTVTLIWHTSGEKIVTVNYSNVGACYAATEASSTTAIALPIPSFTTEPSGNICTGVSVTYTTQSGQTNYVWTVPGTQGTDYSINSGGISSSDNTVTLTWLTVGNKTVTVNYSNSSGNPGATPASSTFSSITVPAITSVINGSTCGNGTVNLSVTASYGGTADWFWNTSGGTTIYTGNAYSPFITADANYYVNATNSCGTTASRSLVFADKNPPAPTILGTSASSVCNAGTAVLSATFDNCDVIRWYDVSSGGTSLITGETFTTDYLTTTTTYYVEAQNCGGISARTAVTATVYPTPTLSSSFTPSPICSGSTFNYTATSATSGATFSWTRAVVSGISNTAGSGSSAIISETLTNTTASPVIVTYRITTSANGCQSTENVSVTVNAVPSVATISSPAALCVGNSLNPTTPTVTANGSTVTAQGWQLETAVGSGTYANQVIPYTVVLADNGKRIRYYATNSCGTTYNTGVTITVSTEPTVTSISAPSNLNVGSSLNPTAPTVTANGSTVTAQGWELETAVGSGSYVTMTVPHTVLLADNGKRIRYYATNSCGSTQTTGVVLTVGCSNTTWTGDSDSDWNNIGNWSCGVPSSSTTVTIPNVNTPGMGYPTITGSVSCKDIIFEQGSAVLGLQNLSYERAFIRIELQRDKWYNMTSPLKEMYSGDYYYNGAPEVSMKLFNAPSPDSIGPNVTYTGTFTRSFLNLQVPLSPSDGYAFKVSPKTWNYPSGSSDILTDLTVTLPRLNPDSSLVTTYFPYSAYSGMLYTFAAKTVTKDSYLAYRFAAENASNQLVDVNKTLSSGLNLVGNPIMTHLKISNFLNTNSTIANVIMNYVRLWTGTSYETYDGSIGDWDGSYTGDLLAPMQSFIVNSPAGGDIIFDLDAHFDVDDNNSQLRSASTENKGVLFVKATKDGKTTGTVITSQPTASNDYGKEDIYKLFTPLTEVADVYSLSSGIALAFNKFSDYPFTAPLCIKTDSGTVALNFNGLESFDDDVIIELINSKTGEVQDLKIDNKYNYQVNEGKDEGNLFVSFRKASTTTDIQSIGLDHDIRIFTTDNNSIRVISTPTDQIKEVVVFDTSGRKIQHCCVAKISTIDIPVFIKNEIYLVQVFTENNTRIAKVLMK